MLKVAEEIVVDVLRMSIDVNSVVSVNKRVADPLPLLRMLSSTFWAVGNNTCIESLIPVKVVSFSFDGLGTWSLNPETSTIVLETEIEEPEVVSNTLGYTFTMDNSPKVVFPMAFDADENVHVRKAMDYERFIRAEEEKDRKC